MNTAEFQAHLTEVNQKWDEAIANGSVNGDDSILTSETTCKGVNKASNANTPKLTKEPVTGQNNRDFKGDWTHRKPNEEPFIYIPVTAVYRDDNFQSINNLRFMCAVSEIAFFNKGDIVKKENYFSNFLQEGELILNGWDFYQDILLPNGVNKDYIREIMNKYHVRLKSSNLASYLFTSSNKKVKLYKDFLQNKDLTLLEVLILSLGMDYKFKDYDAMIKKIGAIFEIDIPRRTKYHYKKIIQSLENKGLLISLSYP